MGLLDRVRGTGCPPIPEYMFDMGAFSITGTPGLPHQPSSYGPRRTVLDKILVDAAPRRAPSYARASRSRTADSDTIRTRSPKRPRHRRQKMAADNPSNSLN